jgi:hypothetical protein
MRLERNTTDEQSVSVKELGPINDGTSDLAEVRITGSYPNIDNLYLRNEVCDMLIYPISGLAEVIIRTRDKRLIHRLDPAKSKEPVKVSKGEGYCYNVALGETLVARLESTPQWYEGQYRTVEYDDV